MQNQEEAMSMIIFDLKGVILIEHPQFTNLTTCFHFSLIFKRKKNTESS